MAWKLARVAHGRSALNVAMAGMAAAMLAACGGDGAQAPAAAPAESGNTPSPAPAASKVLLIGADAMKSGDWARITALAKAASAIRA